MKIVAFVPIKLNSQRLKNKMLLKLGEKYLCQYIFDVLIQVKKYYNIDIYCYCSEENITKLLPKEVLFLKRHKSLDSDSTIGMDIYQSFASEIQADVYMLCHATSPFITVDSIIKGINAVVNEKYDSAFSVSKIQTFSWFHNKPLNYDLNNVIQTQRIEPIYYETSAFYIFNRDVLMNKRRIGEKYYLVHTNRIESVDIDEKEDYELATAIINNINKVE